MNAEEGAGRMSEHQKIITGNERWDEKILEGIKEQSHWVWWGHVWLWLCEQAMDSHCVGVTLSYITWVPLAFEENSLSSLYLGFLFEMEDSGAWVAH